MNDRCFVVYSPPEDPRESGARGPGSRDGVESAYLEALRRLGNVTVVSSLDSLAAAASNGDNIVAFAPLPPGVSASRAAAVIFTGHDIHDDSFRTGPSGCWSDCAGSYPVLLCASEHTAHAVSLLAGSHGSPRIMAIPPPLFEPHGAIRRNHERTREVELPPGAVYVDSDNLALPSEGLLKPILTTGTSNLTEGGRDMPRVLDFTGAGGSLCVLRGFVVLQNQGAWTNAQQAMILLPRRVSGRIRFSMSYTMVGSPRPESIALRFGPDAEPVVIPTEEGIFTTVVDAREAVDQLHFSVYPQDVAPGLPAPLHLLVEWVGLEPVTTRDRYHRPDGHGRGSIPVTGALYTHFLDSRGASDYWVEVLTAFCLTHRLHDDATLLIGTDVLEPVLPRLGWELARIGPIRCRILMVAGNPEPVSYRSLIASTTCLVAGPACDVSAHVMADFMSAGIAPIAVDRGAHSELLRDGEGYKVKSWHVPDARLLQITALGRDSLYEHSWESLAAAFRHSYEDWAGGNALRLPAVSDATRSLLAGSRGARAVAAQLGRLLDSPAASSCP